MFRNSEIYFYKNVPNVSSDVICEHYEVWLSQVSNKQLQQVQQKEYFIYIVFINALEAFLHMTALKKLSNKMLLISFWILYFFSNSKYVM